MQEIGRHSGMAQHPLFLQNTEGHVTSNQGTVAKDCSGKVGGMDHTGWDKSICTIMRQLINSNMRINFVFHVLKTINLCLSHPVFTDECLETL